MTSVTIISPIAVVAQETVVSVHIVVVVAMDLVLHNDAVVII